MPIQKALGVIMLIGGGICFAIGMASESDALFLVGIIFAGIGAIWVLVSLAIAPIMKSSREMAEASGLEVSKLTGAPKLGSSLSHAREQMAGAQQMMAGMTGNAAMRANGHKGSAVVTSADDTGQVSNLNPVYRVGLRITPENGVSYDTVVTSEVSTISVAKAVPGTTVPVTIDGADPNKVLIDWISVT